jgi:hypothetical protein
MSKRYDIEIFPPSKVARSPVPHPANIMPLAPPANSGGIFESMVTQWRANRQTRTWEALTTTIEAAKKYYDAQTQAIESYTKCQEAAFRAQRLPEVAAFDAARTRAEREEELRVIYHRNEMAELHRMTEITRAEAVLLEAEHALQAQREFGYGMIASKRNCELLDLELAVEERRAIQRQHLRELEDNAHSARRDADASNELIDDALYQMRANLNANGLDTSGIDAVIDRRKSLR